MIRLVLLASLAALVVCGAATADPGVCNGSTSLPGCVRLEVDWADSTGAFVNSMMGINGHIDTTPFKPAASLVEDELNVMYWRNDYWENSDRAYNIVTANGGGFFKNMCKEYAEQVTGQDCFALSGVEPWDDSPGGDGEVWYQYCYDEAVDALANGQNPHWDVWNEADNTTIFKTTGGQFRNADFAHLADTYRICYGALVAAYTAEAAGTPSVGGPSLAGHVEALSYFLFAENSPGADWLVANEGFTSSLFGTFGFIPYLETNYATTKIDWMSVHIFWYLSEYTMRWDTYFDDILRQAIIEEITDPGETYTNLLADWGADTLGLDLYVSEYIGNPVYVCFIAGEPSLGADRDTEGECTGLSGIWASDYYADTANSIVAISALHRAEVSGAMRACWANPTDGTSDCSNKTVGSLLVPADPPVGTRPLWWAHKYYADMATANATEHVVVSGYERLDGVASYDTNTESYSMLLGFTKATAGGAYPTDDITEFRLWMTNLPRGLGSTAQVARFDGSIYSAISEPTATAVTVEVIGGVPTIPLSSLSEDEVYYITVGSAPGSVEGITVSGTTLTGVTVN